LLAFLIIKNCTLLKLFNKVIFWSTALVFIFRMENSRRLEEVTQVRLVKKKAAEVVWKRRNAREKDLEQIIYS
jgi:hypothetical protein